MHLANALRDVFGISLGMPAPAWMGADAQEMLMSHMIPYTVHYDVWIQPIDATHSSNISAGVL